MYASNFVALSGLIQNIPEIRTMETGKEVANTKLLISEQFLSEDRNKVEQRTTVLNLAFYRNMVEVARYLDAGDNVTLEGTIRTRTTTRKSKKGDGKDIISTITEIVVMKCGYSKEIIPSKEGTA
jgi:single-stranded DNA-binding protein